MTLISPLLLDSACGEDNHSRRATSGTDRGGTMSVGEVCNREAVIIGSQESIIDAVRFPASDRISEN